MADFKQQRLDSGGVFTGVPPEGQNDLIECIDSVIQDQIVRKLGNASFLALKLMKLRIFLPKPSSLLSFVWTVAAMWFSEIS